MTNQQHPITPPPELFKQWLSEPEYVSGWNGKCTMISITDFRFSNICAKAAQWGADQQLKLDSEQIAQAYQKGADQELKACCDYIGGEGKWFANPWHRLAELRVARRPKPPSLKELALKALEVEDDSMPLRSLERGERFDTIRRALEALPE